MFSRCVINLMSTFSTIISRFLRMPHCSSRVVPLTLPRWYQLWITLTDISPLHRFNMTSLYQSKLPSWSERKLWIATTTKLTILKCFELQWVCSIYPFEFISYTFHFSTPFSTQTRLLQGRRLGTGLDWEGRVNSSYRVRAVIQVFGSSSAPEQTHRRMLIPQF